MMIVVVGENRLMISFDEWPENEFPFRLSVDDCGRLFWEKGWVMRDSVVIAHFCGFVVGVLVYEARRSLIDVILVWVSPKYRRRGIASDMLSIANAKTKRITAEAITTNGLRFMESVGARVEDGRSRLCKNRDRRIVLLKEV